MQRFFRAVTAIACVLAILGAALLPLGVTASHVHKLTVDTTYFVNVYGPLARDQKVQDALAKTTSDAILSRIDSDAVLVATAQQLGLKPTTELGAVAAARLKSLVEAQLDVQVRSAVAAVFASNTFARAWDESLRLSHGALGRALGSTGTVVTLDRTGAIELQIGPIVGAVRDWLVNSGLTIAQRIPDVDRSVLVATSPALGQAQTAYQTVDRWAGVISAFAWILMAAGVVLFMLTSGLRRKEAMPASSPQWVFHARGFCTIIRPAAVVVVAVSAVLLAAFSWGSRWLADSITQPLAARDIASELIEVTVADLGRRLILTLLIAAVIAVAAALWLNTLKKANSINLVNAQVTTPSGHPVATTSGGRVVVLISGAGSNLAALITAQTDQNYGARIVAVVTDKADAGGLEFARAAGIATAIVEPKDFADRAEWNTALASVVASFTPDLVVCAGFMRILGEAFLESFGGRVINTHPALLPSFPGAHGVRDALAYGVKITGCTVHVVDAGVDTGPIIAQATVPVHDDDSESTLHERIKVVERELLVEWVGRTARGGLTTIDRQVRIS